ncbi:MAG: type II toxin-antitoxin system RelE/ParE family toxin [Anaerolineae bacterium]|nr:type II toxin-antitoxin system RelE/ParE family toxin [Anaerolineae bacterium]
MRYEIILAPEAAQDLKRLSARNRTTVQDNIEKHLRFEPDKISKSRIKRLRGLRHPQYRLRVGDIRVFYDLVEDKVEILAVVQKSEAADWLVEMGDLE